MKKQLCFVSLVIAAFTSPLLLIHSQAAPISNAFTYQGQLKHDGVPYNGTANMRFTLYNQLAAGQIVAGPISANAVPVENGLFTRSLDFGPAPFDGTALFLEVAVCTAACGNPNNFTALQPRQPLTGAPHSLQTRGIAVDEAGQVGIGTQIPTNPLTVVGETSINGNLGLGTDTPTEIIHINRLLASTGIRFQSSRFDQGAPLNSTKIPAAATVTGDGQPWSNPNEVRMSNDVRATVSLSAVVGTPDQDQSRDIDLSNLAFNLPAQAQVTGIQVSVEGHGTASCSDCESASINLTAQLLGGGEPSQVFSTNLTASGDFITPIGGQSTNWGLEWTAQQINAATFGVRLATDLIVGNPFCLPFGGCPILACDCTGSGAANIDAVNITVFYFDAPTTTSPVEYSLGMAVADKNFRIAPTADLSSPAITISQQGNVGMGNIDPSLSTQFKLSVNGFAAKPNGGQWASLSDLRLKQNIQPLTNSLSRLLSLRGVTFEFNDKGLRTGLATPGRHAGLIAQEVQHVFPEWVSETTDGNKFLSEEGTTALFIEALRELRAEKDTQIKELQERIKLLESQLRPASSP